MHGSEGKDAPEQSIISKGGDETVTGVHHPSITPYLPAPEKATGAALLVIPGGGQVRFQKVYIVRRYRSAPLLGV